MFRVCLSLGERRYSGGVGSELRNWGLRAGQTSAACTSRDGMQGTQVEPAWQLLLPGPPTAPTSCDCSHVHVCLSMAHWAQLLSHIQIGKQLHASVAALPGALPGVAPGHMKERVALCCCEARAEAYAIAGAALYKGVLGGATCGGGDGGGAADQCGVAAVAGQVSPYGACCVV